MLQITIDTNQATRWELIATSNYLKELADGEVKIKLSDGERGAVITKAVREVAASMPHKGGPVQQVDAVHPELEAGRAAIAAQRTPAPPFPHGEGFDDQVPVAIHIDGAPAAHVPPITTPAPMPTLVPRQAVTLADQALATFGNAVVQGAHAAQARAVVDPVLAAFANQGAAALPNGALSTAAAPPIMTAPVAPLENSAPSTSTPSAPPAPPAPAPATSANVDKNGLPWDERIHAGTKVKVADGTWRMKRNVDPALVTSVTAELRALMNVPAGGVAAAEPWPFAVPGASAAPNVPVPAPAPPSPTIQTNAPVVTATPGPDVAVANLAAATTFGELMGAIPGLVGEQLLTFEEVLKAATEIGLPNGVQGLVARPDLIVPLRTALLAVVQS